MKRYFEHTSSPLFGVVSILPLVVYYEISMFFVHRDMNAEVRNTADVMFKRIFEILGFDGPLAGIAMFALLFVGAALLQGAHREIGGVNINWKYYPLMLAESAFYALILLVLMAFSMNLTTALRLMISPVDIGYSLGAGVYEELLFRALLLQGLLMPASRLPGKTYLWKGAAILISALAFSAAHYIGAAGDVFTPLSFFSRTFGGIMLGGVYMLRGLGAAVYTHAIYDIYTLLL
ncbi:MAG: CPBP family intramembrane glutamic endopeptidase [Fidelibacterota bacterium]